MLEFSFLLIVFSHCTFGKYDCIHEVYRFETYHECEAEQSDWRDRGYGYSACAMISEGENQDPVIHSIGEQ